MTWLLRKRNFNEPQSSRSQMKRDTVTSKFHLKTRKTIRSMSSSNAMCNSLRIILRPTSLGVMMGLLLLWLFLRQDSFLHFNRRQPQVPSLSIQLIVAYCDSNIEWIHKDVIEAILQHYPHATFDIHIMSKCGQEHVDRNFLSVFQSQESHAGRSVIVSSVTVTSLPNVGGCDYVYAKYFKDLSQSLLQNQQEPSSSHLRQRQNSKQSNPPILLFLKDTPRTRMNFHQAVFKVFTGYRPIVRMIEMALDGQFACGLETNSNHSEYHHVPTLYNFTKDGYTRVRDKQKESVKHDKENEKEEENPFNAHNYVDLRDFHSRALDYTFPRSDFIKVCYGGAFALPQSRITSLLEKDGSNLVRVFQAMEESTSESKMSIAEHFLERTWAGLLAQPLLDQEAMELKSSVVDLKKFDGGIYGALQIRDKN